QHRLKRIALAFGLERESRSFTVAPIEPPFSVAEQNVGRLEKSQAGENLAGVVEIDGDRMLDHWCYSSVSTVSVLLLVRSSFSRDACWSAARRSASHHASPHGPQRFCTRAKRSATSRARPSSADGGASLQFRVDISGLAWPWCAATTCSARSCRSGGKALN